jgi:amino acid transporter
VISLGEMTVFAPISGGYIHFVRPPPQVAVADGQAERWLNPAFGFALGWQQVFSGVV